MALLDSTTGIMGDADRVHETVGAWSWVVARRSQRKRGSSAPPTTTGFSLCGRWRSWIAPRTSSVWKPENDLRSLVEEVRGGVRLGAFNEVSLDVVMKTAEDAAVLAGISRWLPGFIQLQESRSPQSALGALASFCRETHNLLMHQDVRRIQGSRIVAGSGFSEGRRVRPLFGNSG